MRLDGLRWARWCTGSSIVFPATDRQFRLDSLDVADLVHLEGITYGTSVEELRPCDLATLRPMRVFILHRTLITGEEIVSFLRC